MCGICGYISKDPISGQDLWDMTNTLAHRGPDDSGVWTHHDKDSGYHIGFGHRRLSIFDLSSLGHQPMEVDGGELAVTFNGEIYNFMQIRAELEKDGVAFRSKCDTEVLLRAYQKWGDECVSRFNGMFAFVIYDKRKNRAVFARDRIGKKPLFYCHCGQTLIFGSELKALMKHPAFKKDINTEMIASYLFNMCFFAPHTVFRGTYKLAPGGMLIWENGTVTEHKYWELTDKYREMAEHPITDEHEAKEGLREKLRESVKMRLAADVPVGLFLSGGIDSSLVAAVAAGLEDKPVKTFTIGVYDPKYNEAERAKKIASHLGADYTEHYISEEDALKLTADIPYYYDEPFSDSSQIPTMLVSSLARQTVPVVLSGDGGDEMFCGYTSYNSNSMLRKLAGSADLLRHVISRPRISGLDIDSFYRTYMHIFKNDFYRNVRIELRNTVLEQVSQKLIKGSCASVAGETGIIPGKHNWQEMTMLRDMLTALPEQMLCKTDRASMRYALELRCPLLDIELIEYSFRLPLKHKYRNGENKYILKQLAYDYIPPHLLDMPKRGFSIPIAKWLRGPLSELVNKYANKEKLDRQGIFEHKALCWLIEKVNRDDFVYKRRRVDHLFPSILWSFLMFQMWYQLYIEDLW